jgi:hypothetical protein
LQDLLWRHAAGKHFEHMADGNPHPPIVGSPPQTSGTIVIRSIPMVSFYESHE